MSKQLDWPRYTRWTWMIAFLALIVLLWTWMSELGPISGNCCGTPPAAVGAAPPSMTTATAPVSPTTLAVVQTVNASWADGKITLDGMVGSKATKKAMLGAAIANYGTTNVIDKINIDNAVKITLTGEVDNNTIKAKRGTEAQAFYSGATVDNQLKVKLKINAEATPAATASKVNAETTPVAVAMASKVMCSDNIVVAANFAKGSGRMSPEMAEVLQAVVPCIKGNYEIGGHTDNIGEDERNQVLSLRRAKTVASYLIEKGVDAKLLKSKGYGEAAPIGDNSTEEGRIKNRRIEFKKI